MLIPQTSENLYNPRAMKNSLKSSHMLCEMLPLALLDIHHHEFSAHYVNYSKLDFHDAFY